MTFISRKTRRSTRTRSHLHASRLRLEALEDRCVLTAGMLDQTFGVGGIVATNFLTAPGVLLGQTDGKVVVVGSSTVARYNSNGSLDPTFGSGGLATIGFGFAASRAAMQGDKIVVAGPSSDGGTGLDFAVARLNADGTPDLSFDGDGKQTIDFGSADDAFAGVAIQGDKIVVAGTSPQGSTGLDFAVARLNADGTLDDSFDGDGKQTIDFGSVHDHGYAVAVQGSRIVVAGSTHQGPPVGAGTLFAVACLDDTGTLDSSFDADGERTIDFGGNTIDVAQNLAIDGDKILVAGYANSSPSDGYQHLALTRLNSDGSFDLTFSASGVLHTGLLALDLVQNMAAQGDKVVLAGLSWKGATGYDVTVLQLNHNGGRDFSFGGNGQQTIHFGNVGDVGYGVVMLEHGDIVVAGYADNQGWSPNAFAMARLQGSHRTVTTTALASSASTTQFGQSVTFTATVTSGTGTPTGTLTFYDGGTALATETLVAGTAQFTTSGLAGGLDHAITVAYHGDTGAGYSSSSATTTQRVKVDQTISFEPPADGSYHGGAQPVLLSATASSGLPVSFAVLGGPATVSNNRLTITGAGTVVIEASVQVDGPFNAAPVVVRSFTVDRLTATGRLDPTFGNGGWVTVDFSEPRSHIPWFDIPFPPFHERPTGVAVQGDGSILVVGTVNDDPELRVAATLAPNGGLTRDYELPLFFTPTAVQADGKTLVVGAGPGFSVRRFNADGSPDTSFGNGGSVTLDFLYEAQATAVAVQPDGKIVVVGYTNQQWPWGLDFVVARLEGYDPAVVGTEGNDTIDIAAGTQAGTLKLTVNGQVTDNVAPEGLMLVEGLGGDDTITVTAAPAQGLILAGRNGSDTYDIMFGNLAGTVTVADHGTPGPDQLIARGTPADDHLFKDGTKVTLGNPVRETILHAGIESLTIHGGGGNDTITDPGSDTYLFGDEGDDTIVINATSGSGVTADGGAGSDTYVIGGTLLGPVSIVDSGSSGTDAVTIVGAPGDALVQTADGFTINGIVISLGGALETVEVEGFNAAPTIEAIGSQEATEAGLIVRVAATDPDVGDTLTYSVSYVSRTGAGAVNAPTGFSIDADGVFHWTPGGGQLGQYTFRVRIEDSGGESSEQTFVVTTLGVVDGVLTIVGTNGADRIAVKPTDGDPDELTVRINEKDYRYKLKPRKNPDNPYTGVTLIHISSLGGDDQVTVHGQITTSAWIKGGAGNDKLTGARGDDVIEGGTGDDQLFGDDGNDVLVGGPGDDKIRGEKGHDILIAAEIDGTHDYAALRAFSEGWADSHGVSEAQAIEAALDEVLDDWEGDQLTGGAGADLFVIHWCDQITDYQFGKPKANKEGDVVIRNGVLAV